MIEHPSNPAADIFGPEEDTISYGLLRSAVEVKCLQFHGGFSIQPPTPAAESSYLVPSVVQAEPIESKFSFCANTAVLCKRWDALLAVNVLP